MRRCVLTLSMVCLFASLSAAEDLLLVSGLESARFSDFDSSGALSFFDAKDQPMSVAAEKLIRYGNEPITDFESGLLMVDGSWIVGRIERVAEDRVSIAGRYFQTTLSLQGVRGIALHLPIDPLQRQRIINAMTEADGGDDRLLTVTGDSVAGVLQLPPKIDGAPLASRGSWEIRRRERNEKVEAASLRAVVLSPLLHPIRLADAGFWFALDDGSRLAIESVEHNGAEVRLETFSGQQLSFAASWDQFLQAVRSIQPASSATSWLAKTRPAAFKQQSTLSTLQWPLAVDSGLRGEPLIVSGNRYRHGLTMHASAQAAYAIPADATRFRASIAVADVSEVDRSGGSVVFQVVTADASKAVTPQYTSPTLRPGDAAISLDIHVQGAKLLLLLVTDAGDGSSGDVAVWLDARFLRADD